MIEIKKKLVPLIFVSILLLLSGGLGFALATSEIDGNGLQKGDLDRDRVRDQDCDQDQDCTCDGPCDCQCNCQCPSEGEEKGNSNSGDGIRNRYGSIEGREPKMMMFHWALEWQYQYQYQWDPVPE